MTERYPIRHETFLADILAKFREELNNALIPINERLTKLESAIHEGKAITPERAPEKTHKKEKPDPATLRNMIIQLRYMNVALRGYGQLLVELGLPKDMRKTIIALENMEMMILRIMQFIHIMDMMSKASALAAFGPMGYIIAGGFLASTLAYGSKVTGGF